MINNESIVLNLQETKSKLALVITDGVGFRNYVLSDFLNKAQHIFDEIIIFSGLPLSSFHGFEIENCTIEVLEDFREPPKTWFFRKLKEIAHLQLHKNNNFGINDNLKNNYPKTNSKRGILTKLIFAWSHFFKSEKWIRKYYKLQQKSFSTATTTKRYVDLLKRHNPDILYFTHQRPPYIAPIILASEILKIKTATFIFSWDNLASKGRMSGNFDYYFVWSALMKKELLEFYKKVDESKVKIVGTPQFEPYVLERYSSKETYYYKQFKLEATKKTICFSCGDISTSRNDELYIETIADAISCGNICESVNLLVRTSPAEEPTRFSYLKEKYPFIAWNYPKWELSRADHQEAWSQRIPTAEDIKDLRSILTYSDVFINMCSTMSLDAMFFNKPVINPVFGNESNGLYNDQRFLKYRHYKKVIDSGAVAVVKNTNELINETNRSLNEPQLRLILQKNLLRLQIGCGLQGTSQRIVNNIKECAG